MNGAREFAEMFRTGQHDRLYLVSGHHARGKTFHIYVLPEGVAAESNGPCNGPVNSDAVEVYGIVGGQPGWTESYGWLHKGRWQADFAELVAKRQAEIDAAALAYQLAQRASDKQVAAKKASLLANY